MAIAMPSKTFQPPVKGDPREHLIYANSAEEKLLKALGGAGAMTKAGVRSFYEPDGNGGITPSWTGDSSTTTSDPTSYVRNQDTGGWGTGSVTGYSSSDNHSSRFGTGQGGAPSPSVGNSYTPGETPQSSSAPGSYGSRNNAVQTLNAIANVLGQRNQGGNGMAAFGMAPIGSQTVNARQASQIQPVTFQPTQQSKDYVSVASIPDVPNFSGPHPQPIGFASMASPADLAASYAKYRSPPGQSQGQSQSDIPAGASSWLGDSTKAQSVGTPPQGFMTPQQQAFDRMQVNNGSLLNQSLGGRMGLPDSIVTANEMAKTAYGETGKNYANPSNLAAVDQVMLNRMGLMENKGQYGGTPQSVLGGFDANGYDRARVGAVAGPQGNPAYQSATFGSPQLGAAANSLSDQLQGTGPQLPAGVMNATNYYNPQAASPPWANNGPMTRFGPHVFGNPDPGRSASVVADNRPSLGASQVASAAPQNPLTMPPNTQVASQDSGFGTFGSSDFRPPGGAYGSAPPGTQMAAANGPASPLIGMDSNSPAYQEAYNQTGETNSNSFPVEATNFAKHFPIGKLGFGIAGLVDRATGGLYGNQYTPSNDGSGSSTKQALMAAMDNPRFGTGQGGGDGLHTQGGEHDGGDHGNGRNNQTVQALYAQLAVTTDPIQRAQILARLRQIDPNTVNYGLQMRQNA